MHIKFTSKEKIEMDDAPFLRMFYSSVSKSYIERYENK